jgi:hypothetical protein
MDLRQLDKHLTTMFLGKTVSLSETEAPAVQGARALDSQLLPESAAPEASAGSEAAALAEAKKSAEFGKQGQTQTAKPGPDPAKK